MIDLDSSTKDMIDFKHLAMSETQRDLNIYKDNALMISTFFNQQANHLSPPHISMHEIEAKVKEEE